LKALAEHGKNLSKLQEINLKYNKITDAGLRAFAEHSKNFPNLQEIDLSMNQITTDYRYILSGL
jgi:hypothetical protein